MIRLAPIVVGLAAGLVHVAPLASSAGELALDARQARAFATICARCHTRPGIGVPVIGDDQAWAPRRAKGLEVLLRHTIEGFGDMPPLGTCGSCSEADFRRLVALVAGLPAAPAAGAAEDDRARDEGSQR